MFERFSLMSWRSRAGAVAVMVGLVIGSVSAVGGAAPAAAASSPTGWAQIVSSGFAQTCGLTSGGAAWCWGGNDLGQLGNGTTVDSAVPVAVSGGHTFSQIGGGVGFACGIEVSTGAAWCWGRNSDGQLGDGNVGTDSGIPVAVVGGHAFSRISAGGDHACAIDASTGAAWCWGNGGSVLGDGTGGTDGSVPVSVIGGHTWSQVSSGAAVTCGVEAITGAAWCWGDNSSGELGDGNPGAYSEVPVAVSGGHSWSQLDAGARTTCGIEASTGAAWCWGMILSDPLGTGFSSVPVAVSGGHTWSQISTNGFSTCAIDAVTSAAWCWGQNPDGALGAGDIGISSLVPVAVSGGNTWSQVSVGGPNGCGIESATGAAWCWGANQGGQLGDGNTGTASHVPVGVTPIPQTVAFGVLSGVALPMRSLDVSGTVSSTSGLPVTVLSSSLSVCTVSGMTVNLVAGGTCVLSASQPGDGAFAAAASIEQSFTVTPAPAPPTTVPVPEPVPVPPTTTPVPPSTTPAPIPVAVASSPAPQAVVNPAATTPVPVPSTLATTGAPIGPAVGGAIVLIGLGAALIIMERRRTRRAN